MFYEVEQIVMIDALVNHSALTMDDFKQIFASGGRSQKELLKFVSNLRENALVFKYGRQETKVGAQKSTTVEYYYIDYQAAVDAIKFKLNMMQEKVDREGNATKEKIEFHCDACHTDWTMMEALDGVDMVTGVFHCKRCQNPMKQLKPEGDGQPEETSAVTKFNAQLKPILKLIENINKIERGIPTTTAESAIEYMKPVPKQKEAGLPDDSLHDLPKAIPTSVKGIRGQAENIEVIITSESANQAAANKAEAERRAKLLTQNQMPQWYQHSTVDGSVAKPGAGVAGQRPGAIGNAVENNGTTNVTVDSGALDDIFGQIVAAAAQEETVESDDESDEDEDEFEDVTSPVLKKPRLDFPEQLSPEVSTQTATQTITQVTLETEMAVETKPEATPTENADGTGDDDDDSEEEEFETVV